MEQILSAYEFEQHAGFKTRHPNNHIYLENGRPIYSVIQEIKSAPLSILDEVIKEVAGSCINVDSFEDWKGIDFSNNSSSLLSGRFLRCLGWLVLMYDKD